MNYMIHAAPPRMWYVEEFLIPSMLAQGIRRDEIEVRNDADGKGNLLSCMDAFRACAGRAGGTWHLQDDVIISRDFAERTAEHDDGIVAGFGCNNFGAQRQQAGRQPAVFLWYSFQCIRIPNGIAAECARWFYDEACHRARYVKFIAERKHDDMVFRDFLIERHPDLWVENLSPSIVDHIDYLIGGTLVNRLRRIQLNRADRFEDADLVDALQCAVNKRKIMCP